MIKEVVKEVIVEKPVEVIKEVFIEKPIKEKKDASVQIDDFTP